MLIVLFGPTGAGKTELIRLLAARTPLLAIAPDMTRALRPGETDKTSLTEVAFSARECEGRYIWINSMFGVRYGTPREPVEAALENPQPSHVIDYPIERIVDLDGLAGAKRGVIVMPPSEEVLVARLELCGREARTLDAVRQYRTYYYLKISDGFPQWVVGTVVNTDLEQAYSQLCVLVLEQGNASQEQPRGAT